MLFRSHMKERARARFPGGSFWKELTSLMIVLVLSACPQVKCHQYWPNPDCSATYGPFQVACHAEEGNCAFLVRDMTLTHLEVAYARSPLRRALIFWGFHRVC